MPTIVNDPVHLSVFVEGSFRFKLRVNPTIPTLPQACFVPEGKIVIRTTDHVEVIALAASPPGAGGATLSAATPRPAQAYPWRGFRYNRWPVLSHNCQMLNLKTGPSGRIRPRLPANDVDSVPLQTRF